MNPNGQVGVKKTIDMAFNNQDATNAMKHWEASDIIAHNKGIIKFFTSTEKWFGMTYPEDREIVKVEIANKIKSGYYPEQLWQK